MVEEPRKHEVLLTPQFLEDLEECVDYISESLSSPLAAKKMYEAIRGKVMGLAVLPESAPSYVSPTTGKRRYKVSYNRYDIHYTIEGGVVRVLGIKHQLQERGWVD